MDRMYSGSRAAGREPRYQCRLGLEKFDAWSRGAGSLKWASHTRLYLSHDIVGLG